MRDSTERSVHRSGHQASGKCSFCPVRYLTDCLCAGPEASAEFDRISHRKTYARGHTIIGQDSRISFVGNVVRGVVKLTKTLADGHQQVVGILYPGDFFGRVFASTSPFGVEAATDVELCCFDQTTFERFAAAHPDFERKLLSRALDELDSTRQWLVLIGSRKTLERVAAFLLFIFERNQRSGCPNSSKPFSDNVIIPIARSDVAGYLGTTVETISRQLQYLSREKIIRIVDPHEFEILDEYRLTELAGEFVHTVMPQRMVERRGAELYSGV